jgi:PhnB protein
MQVSPYLNFKGNCAEAFRFYEKCFGGKIEMMMTHGDAPPDTNVNPEWKNMIMHVRLNVKGAIIMGSDAPGDYYKQPQGWHVSLSVDSAAEAERIYKELSEGGNVTMPLEQTFWSQKFAMLNDRFGIPWMINFQTN